MSTSLAVSRITLHNIEKLEENKAEDSWFRFSLFCKHKKLGLVKEQEMLNAYHYCP